LLSANQTHLGAWSAALSGVVVISNNLDTATLAQQVTQGRFDPRARYAPLLIQPVGLSANPTNPPPLQQIFDAITQARRAQPSQMFTNLGQILAIPALTTESPFLNRTDPDGLQVKYGIDDFAYERIPQQILGLLRVGQPRFVIYAYGQALKPERVNPATRLVDNYQITAEFATRTVLRVEGTAQKPRVVVEAFNILPPD